MATCLSELTASATTLTNTLSNFEITRDATFGKARTSGK